MRPSRVFAEAQYVERSIWNGCDWNAVSGTNRGQNKPWLEQTVAGTQFKKTWISIARTNRARNEVRKKLGNA